MVDIKAKLWIIVILAGILGLVSIFTPTLYISSEDASIWVWNLYVSPHDFDFVQTDEALYDIGIIATIVLSIGIWITLFSGIILKLKDKDLTWLSLIGGLLLIIGPIIYLAGITAEENTFWDYANVNIGSILPFIAGAIAILGGVLGILKKRS